MPFANVHGHRLYFEDSGGSGPVVLFSHGFLLDHSMWDAQVAALAPEFRCITWDERGHGMSECRGPFDFWDAANDAVALLDHVGVASAAFVGLSQGGFLAQRAALAHPARVAALVLVDTAAALFTEQELEGYGEMHRAWVTEGPTDELAGTMAGLLFGPDHDASKWIGKWRAKPPQEHDEPWKTVLGRDELLSRLGEIRCPSLVLHGSDDQAFDVATAEGLRDALGDCRGLALVMGAHHVPPVTHPEETNLALGDFLRKVHT